MHTHTVASTHAYSTITENCTRAAEIGLKALAMTDHTTAMPDSPHIWHTHNLRVLPREINKITVLKGAEINITDYDGSVDLTEAELKSLEWIVASMHKYCLEPTTSEEHTRGYLNIAKNPHVDVIGHCTTDFFPFDYEKCLKAFKEYNKLVEVNESSIRMKKGSAQNVVPILKLCKKLELPVVVNSDAHFWTGIGDFSVSLKILDEVGFPERLVLNADWDKLKEWICEKRPNLNL